jgi:alkylhydroperoxidase/carboxymuconolactone decarboxylase family protein YurZ
VHIILKQDKEKLIIIAKDEGIGFDMNKETNTSSQGLKNISQRFQSLSYNMMVINQYDLSHNFFSFHQFTKEALKKGSLLQKTKELVSI